MRRPDSGGTSMRIAGAPPRLEPLVAARRGIAGERAAGGPAPTGRGEKGGDGVRPAHAHLGERRAEPVPSRPAGDEGGGARLLRAAGDEREGEIETAGGSGRPEALRPFHQADRPVEGLVEAELGGLVGAAEAVEVDVPELDRSELVDLDEGVARARDVLAAAEGRQAGGDHGAGEGALAGAEHAMQAEEVAGREMGRHRLGERGRRAGIGERQGRLHDVVGPARMGPPSTDPALARKMQARVQFLILLFASGAGRRSRSSRDQPEHELRIVRLRVDAHRRDDGVGPTPLLESWRRSPSRHFGLFRDLGA